MRARSGAVYSAAQVRELDRRAIEVCGLGGYELMTRAGLATLDAIRSSWPDARSLTVLCGPGNNAGDGYVIARSAASQGLRAQAVALTDPLALAGDARHAYDDFVAAGGRAIPWSHDALEGDVIVDALFGTGLNRPLTGDVADAIATINAAGRPVISVDIPSGLHADTGAVLGTAVRAQITVTFIGRKIGCYVGAGLDHCGELRLHELGVLDEAYWSMAPVAYLLDASDIRAALPPRSRAAHKGDHGHVLVVGGAPGMSGAVRLAGEAALRSGAGLVTVACHPASVAALASRPELMGVAAGAAADLESVLERATVVAIGPGLGQDEWSISLLERVLGSGRPLVVDADALNLLASRPKRRDDWILTPHPGEAARLLGRKNADVQGDRIASAAELQRLYHGNVVLKGAGSIVQSPDEPAVICDRGNPGMAAAGMGDVLTGVIAGIAGQCHSLAVAARAGVLVHAQAGDLAARRGERGLTAGDVIAELRNCVNPR
jgi:ADP-dependent NAD(P)H-hydrate dehydratase / NAD(P)H-hydrate epimerase